MTCLGLDVGMRRVGVAVGSSDLRLATPLAVFARRAVEFDAEQVAEWAARYDAERIIVGLPRERDGAIGRQAQQVMLYVDRLKARVPLPFEYFDERYSTAQALARRREMGVTEREGRATIDAAAAAVILQDYLDSTFSPSV